MNDDFDPSYAGAHALTALIDREDILTSIKRVADDESQATRVFYITAAGGIGKTFLLREVLSRFQPGAEWYRPDILAASHEVDFYHSDNHTVEGRRGPDRGRSVREKKTPPPISNKRSFGASQVRLARSST